MGALATEKLCRIVRVMIWGVLLVVDLYVQNCHGGIIDFQGALPVQDRKPRTGGKKLQTGSLRSYRPGDLSSKHTNFPVLRLANQ